MPSNILRREDIKVIGVTGGTGSGKSTVAEILAEFGGVIIDADTISKELMQQGGAAYEAVIRHFGSEIVAADGEIDRKKLGNRVFQDPQQRLKLNALTHPLVGDEIQNRVDKLKEDLTAEPLKEGELRFIVLDVPIPVEHGFFDLVNSVWAVIANDDVRIERIMRRNGLAEEEAESRLLAQLSNREYMQIADIIIENERDKDALKAYIAKELVHYFDIDTDGYDSGRVQ